MNYHEAELAFEELFSNTLDDEAARQFLISLYERGENEDELAAAIHVMRKHSIKLPISHELREKAIDIVGTGGDKSGSINISSTASLIVASLGVHVAKHGNRSITSNSGSADMLEALGLNLHLNLSQQVTLLEETGFVFMFAGNHHPAMKHIMPIRKSIPHRTIFNLLGPLTNPADVKREFIGLYDKKYNTLVAKALHKLGTKKAMIVGGYDGLDEISICANTFATTLEEGRIRDFVIDPLEYGIRRYNLDDIQGGNAQENAQITLSILNNERHGAMREIVVINSAAALMVANKAHSFQEGIAMANEAIDSKKAINHLQKIIQVSQKL